MPKKTNKKTWTPPTPSEVKAWWEEQTGQAIPEGRLERSDRNIRSPLFMILEMLEDEEAALEDFEIVLNRDQMWQIRNPDCFKLFQRNHYFYWWVRADRG